MRKFISKWIPILWSICWAAVITAVSLGAAIWCVKWVLNLIGVI